MPWSRTPRSLHQHRHRCGEHAGGRDPEGVQQDGQWRDGETSFLKVNVWRGQAEHLAEFLTKGDRVMVTGRLRPAVCRDLDDYGASDKLLDGKASTEPRPRPEAQAKESQRRLWRPVPVQHAGPLQLADGSDWWQTRSDKRMLTVTTADRPGTVVNDVGTSNQALSPAHGDRHQTLLDRVTRCELGPVFGT